jgi:hypothetical protein
VIGINNKRQQMNSQSSSSSSASSSSATSSPSKVIRTKNSELVTINEKVNLTKEQNEVLQMICNSYEMTISEYMQQALVEALRFDIEEGNFSDVLLEKLGGDKKKENANGAQRSSVQNELDIFKKSQTPNTGLFILVEFFHYCYSNRCSP